ncbi:MAG: 1-deoxy-D-xylulose-5-phosphate synthase [Puniceicoccales bacterium]|jgi:1-deoxy-D-xylulose-5-phosphate synthase|nr:1-deoxy-D-xylulose-5-phosphate synthase [Puniceicoccales bacterium]
MLLETLKDPTALKTFSHRQLTALAEEIRTLVYTTVTKNGGHLASNLGVVELSIALHYVFNSPRDALVWDVSHQIYTHKLLTGRYPFFHRLRQTEGVSGFSCPDESEHDLFTTGHAGTALSSALGLAKARDLRGGNDHIIILLGDASMTNGLTLEALSNIASTTQRLIVILNDNGFSIAPNVGAIAKILSRLIQRPAYAKCKRLGKSFLNLFPGGSTCISALRAIKRRVKSLFLPSSLFEDFGLRYWGPVDGHHLPDLIYYLQCCQKASGPILLHVKTQKGHGIPDVATHPEKFHSVAPQKTKSTQPTFTYGELLGKCLESMMEKDPQVVAITAAMARGTGLASIQNKFPQRVWDVGMAEAHAVTFAAGMAKSGFFPVCAIYSTFMQRAVDSFFHDVALQGLPMLICMDRSGLSCHDGPTHHGLFDIALFASAPSVICVQPKDSQEWIDLFFSARQWKRPVLMRYPRECPQPWPPIRDSQFIPLAHAEVLEKGRDICLCALGPMVDIAQALVARFSAHGLSVTVINMRFIVPLDEVLLKKILPQHRLCVTLEDHVVYGGLGSILATWMALSGIHTPLYPIGWPNRWVEHANCDEDLQERYGLTEQKIFQCILERWKTRPT